jgi:acetylornithine/N-succinyldiaminopimelate aminotransferase
MGNDVAAVIVEPVQGEGGVIPGDPRFLADLSDMVKEHNALLICDEVQSGLGRAGTLWAHEAAGIEPDIMTLAKPLGGGMPIGATLCKEFVASAIQPGDHGERELSLPPTRVIAVLVVMDLRGVALRL